MKKTKFIFISAILILTLLSGCKSADNSNPAVDKPAPVSEVKVTQKNTEKSSIILATTTSTEDSGLLEYILPDFKNKTGIEVKVVAVGTGQALQMGIDGDADILLVHAKPSEEEFVANNHGKARYDVMYNDFVIIGPANDSAKISGLSVKEALNKIKESGSKFISRGDKSGTHQKELSLWEAAPEGEWYVSVGKGMGDTITIANEMLAYTLTDRATYLSMKDNIDLKVLVEADKALFNQYGVIPVNPEKNDKINSAGANAFLSWIISDETQKLIGSYKKFGEVLFTPNAK